MLQTYGFAGPRDINAQGYFFLYQASNAATIGASDLVNVEVDGQPLGELRPGDSIRLPEGAQRWTLTPADPALAGTVLIGDGEAQTARISGQVEIINGEVAKTLKGSNYYGIFGRPGQASVFAAVGVFNGTNNGTSVAIHQLAANVESNGLVGLWLTNSQPLSGLASSNMKNKRMSAPFAEALYTSIGQCATYPPLDGTDFTGGIGLIGRALLRAGETRKFAFGDAGPLILPAGKGLYLISESNAATGAIWAEVECEALGPLALGV